MILNNWVTPTSFSKPFSIGSIGYRFQNHHLDEKNSNRLLVLSDRSEKSSCIEHFWDLEDHFDQIDIAYLGHLNNENPEFAIPLLSELLAKNNPIVLLSTSNSFLSATFNALKAYNSPLKLCYFGDRLDLIRSDAAQRMISSEHLDNLVFAGFQRHFCSLDDLEFIRKNFTKHLSLGEVIQNIEGIEPTLRSMNAGTFSMKSIQRQSQPNGLSNYQACQIMKQFGMANHLKILNLCDIQVEDAPLVGQLLWYFTEGIHQREQALNFKEKAYFQEHVVHFETIGPLTFLKSNQTGRWWFEIPSTDKSERGSIYPCTELDFEKAKRNDLSDFIVDQINQIA